MAYLVQQANSPFWTAQWRGADGKIHKRSTRVRIKPDFRKDGHRETAAQARARAQNIADTLEQADKGTGTAQKLHAALNALLPSGGVPTIRAYCNTYLTARTAQRPKTVANDRRAFASLLAYLGKTADLTIDQLTTGHVNGWLEEESSRIRPSTVKLYRNCVHTAFRRAFEEELISRDPFALARTPRVVDSSPIVRRSFTLADLRQLVSLLSPDWAMAVRLCVLLGGLRLGDVCNLRWEQFNFERDTCELVTGKRGIPMLIPLLPSLKKHLLAWPRTSAYVLPPFHARYNSKSRSVLSTEFTALVRAFGLGKMTGEGSRSGSKPMTDLTFHMLRSTAATILHEAGVDAAIAMRILSHNSRSVHEVYVRPSDDSIRRGMSHLDIDL